MAGNNPPDVVLELTTAQAQFLLRNCDSNIEFALKAMMQMESQSAVAKLVELNEQFKDIRNLLKRAGVE